MGNTTATSQVEKAVKFAADFHMRRVGITRPTKKQAEAFKVAATWAVQERNPILWAAYQLEILAATESDVFTEDERSKLIGGTLNRISPAQRMSAELPKSLHFLRPRPTA